MSQFERNQKVLVSKTVTVDATTLADLAEGELALIKPNGTLLTAGDDVADAPQFFIVQGTSTAGAPKFSQKITGKNITKFSGTSYAAPVQQVVTVPDTTAVVTTASATNETTYVIHIVFKHDKEIGSKRQLARAISYVAPAGTTTANVLIGLAAAINANALAKQYVVATIASDDLVITGLAQAYTLINGYKLVSFTVGIEGYSTVVITRTTAPDKGVGSYALVADLEYFAIGNSGITNRVDFPVPTAAWAIDAVLGTTYDVYVIDSFDKHASADVNGQIESPLQTIIAVPAGSANGTAFEALINPYVASVGLNAVTL